MEKGYNGWSNRETWLVPLWWNECPIETVTASSKEEAVRVLADELEELFDMETEGFETNSLIWDLLSGAISCINWDEIAAHWIDDIEVVIE